MHTNNNVFCVFYCSHLKQLLHNHTYFIRIFGSSIFIEIIKYVLCISDCPLNVGNLTRFGQNIPISCHLKEHCTAVECCIDFQDPLQQTFHLFVDLNLCLQTFEIGIEKFVEKRTLFTYTYGVQDHYRLGDVVQIE